ncbi:GNAT family N-acetyltransferase [Meridianimarinicoccus sp. MJW13]|uniref:GNAT family N-acetyltransferase n=1 Tax=Meridianimarinicoccus sp. MJW13 TaxID=2720031 RepID=UPI00299F88A2|nr:GNAT family N-acetyltransferase [Fluviibacterium sp. MJW13]
MTFEITPADWSGFQTVMGPKGGCGGCWCRLWRVPKKVHDADKGDGNRDAMRALFDSGAVPGLLAMDGATPVGWISVAPRTEFPGLKASRILQPVDDLPVWSVSCFLVMPPYRRQGLSVHLLQAACAFASERGAPAIEGYPIDGKDKYPPVYGWTGFAGAYRSAGFTEIARRSRTRPIMRKSLD